MFGSAARKMIFSGAFIVLTASLLALFYCEYAIYFVVISQCSWPKLDTKLADKTIVPKSNSTELKAMFIADTHLLGPYRGHWFDKLKREWQMYRAFQTSVTLYKPEVVFVLGDLFDEGQYCNEKQFNNYMERFASLFEVPKGVKVYAVPGNHDLGFHYRLRYDLYEKFNTLFKTSPVQFTSIKGNHFILINSMALHGDGCYFCTEAQYEIQAAARRLSCLKSGKSCAGIKKSKAYSRPIVLQHFPMFRESDAICNDTDSAPDNIKKEAFREKWECLSRNASEMIYDVLNPRLIFTGHTHHGCTVRHREDIVEFTLPSFNWRNKINPTFTLGVFTSNNYAVAKCDIPKESTVIFLYWCPCGRWIFMGYFCMGLIAQSPQDLTVSRVKPWSALLLRKTKRHPINKAMNNTEGK